MLTSRNAPGSSQQTRLCKVSHLVYARVGEGANQLFQVRLPAIELVEHIVCHQECVLIGTQLDFIKWCRFIDEDNFLIGGYPQSCYHHTPFISRIVAVHAPFASMPTYTDQWLLEELAEEVCSGGVWLLA